MSISNIIYLLAIFVIAMLIVLVPRKYKYEIRPWADFAAELGMKFEASDDLSLKFSRTAWGVYRGRAMKLDTYIKSTTAGKIFHVASAFLGGGGSSGTLYTRIQRGLKLNNSGLLSLELHKRKRTMPLQEIGTGDREFDRLYTLTGSPPGLVSPIFSSPILRDRLRELKGSLKVDVRGLHYEERGYVKDPVRLRMLFNLLADVSAEIEKAEAEYQ